MTTDRHVHARSISGDELVRYDRAGKWYWEEASTGVRDQLNMSEVVSVAIRWAGTGGTVFFKVPGGSTFDRKVWAILGADSRG